MARARSAIQTPSMAEWAGATVNQNTGVVTPKKRRAKSKTVGAFVFDRTLRDTKAMIDSQDWEGCKAQHLVGLYVLMHRKVYRVDPSISSKEKYVALMRAASFVKQEFGGSFERAIDYLRWAWTEEMKTERWRRENGREGGHLGIWRLFSGDHVTRYRVAAARLR